MKLPIVIEVMGDPGVGKTHFSLMFPQPYLFDITPVKEALAVYYKFSVANKWDDIAELAMFKDEYSRYYHPFNLAALRKKVSDVIKRDDVRYVIFDSAQYLQPMAVEEYLQETGKKAVYPITEYHYVRSKIDVIINNLIKSGKSLIFVATLKDEYVGNQKTGRRIPNSYINVEYLAHIRVMIKIENEKGSNVRKYIVFKNRFKDTATDWVVFKNNIKYDDFIKELIPKELIDYII